MEIVIIVDTCHASAAIEGDGAFKPGPMGSRGLGQLAYDTPAESNDDDIYAFFICSIVASGESSSSSA